jgi:ASC-1-like (ASCH) protein
MTHQLKIQYQYAKLHFRGLKDWEIRYNDRDFKTGDLIIFSVIEFGFMYSCEITNVYSDTDNGLQEDYVILTIKNKSINQ